MFLEIITRFRQWAYTHALIRKPQERPFVVVFWPNQDYWRDAVMAMRRDKQLTEVGLARNEELLDQPNIEGVPIETWVIDGIPVIHTTTQGDRLVAARPSWRHR